MSREDRDRWEHRHAAHEHGDSPAAFLVAHAALLGPGAVLDLAAGGGRNAVHLARLGRRVIALDVARAGLERIRRRQASIAVVQMDLDAPGIRTASVENVVWIDFLDRALFGEVRRWLRPGGVLLVDTFLAEQASIGHPRHPDHLLRRGELLDRLAGWRILRHREGLVEEGGRHAFRAGAVAVRG